MVKRGFETKLVYATAIFVYSFHHRFVWVRAFIMGKVENRVQKARKHSFGNLLLYHCTGFMKIHYVVDYHCAGLNGFWNWNCIKLIVRRYNGCTRTRGARTVNFYLVPFFIPFFFLFEILEIDPGLESLASMLRRNWTARFNLNGTKCFSLDL